MTTIIASSESKIQKNRFECALCKQPAAERFCCHGCEAIFEILSAQGQLKEKEAHLLYRQAVKYGVISNPGLQKLNGGAGKERYAFEVQGMWCTSCASLIQLLVADLKGVQSCHVDYMTDLASISYDPMEVSKEEIKQRIEQFGYRCFSLEDPGRKALEFPFLLRLSIAFFSALNVMMFAYPLYSTFFDFDSDGLASTLSWISFGLTLPVVTYCAWPIYQRFYLSLKHGVPGMEALVVIGMTASMSLSLWSMAEGSHIVYFDTVTMLIALLLFGKWVEQRAKLSAKEAWFELQYTLPKKARKRSVEGEVKIIPLKEVKEGDHLCIFQGEKIPLDGIVMEGEAGVDESSLTGESLPVIKGIGDTLIAGSLLQTGRLLMRAVTTFEKSSVRQLAESLEEQVVRKSDRIKKADFIASWFTPGILALSIIALPVLWTSGVPLEESFLRIIAMLLIACPCAIGIAQPLAESRLIQRFAEQGAIVRNRGLFTSLAKASLYIFDKTGTLTEGRLHVKSGLELLSTEELAVLKTLTAYSIHPVSLSVFQAIHSDTITLSSWNELPGKGIQAIFAGKEFSFGSKKWMEERGVDCPSCHDGLVAFFEKEGQCITTIELEDQMRQGANELPQRKMLLSGDRKEPVRAVALALGFKEWHAEMTPEEKAAKIEALQKRGECIVFVGDGINDAKALSVADVGISIVSAADISYHVSDLYLLSGRLDQFLKLQKLAQLGDKVIRQNFFWAFFYNALGIPLAIAGTLSPLFATFAMAASSLMVLFNSRRI